MFRLNIVRQVHCLCKYQSFPRSNLNRSLPGNLQIKVNLPHILRACYINTDNCNKQKATKEVERDALSEVYRGSISNFIYRVKAFSLMTSVFGIATQPVIVNSALNLETNTALLIGACTFISFFTFVTPVLLHLVTKRYILRLEYCPETDEYYATTYSFFLRSNIDKFKAVDVFIPDIPGMLTTFEVKKKPFFVDKDSFLDLEHYKKLMGYDKPMDFKLGKPETLKKE